MTDRPPQPDECRRMEQVRAGVDATDGELLDLLARRFAYMRAAAHIKTERAIVRDEVRKAKVIANVVARARELDIPGAAVAELWDRLIEHSIAYELEQWDRLHGD